MRKIIFLLPFLVISCKDPNSLKEPVKDKIVLLNTKSTAQDQPAIDSVKMLRDSLNLIHTNMRIHNIVFSLPDTIQNTDLHTEPSDFVSVGAKWRKVSLKIYNKFEYKRRSPSLGFGKWEYWITSATNDSFRLISDSNYQIGQEIKITLK